MDPSPSSWPGEDPAIQASVGRRLDRRIKSGNEGRGILVRLFDRMRLAGISAFAILLTGASASAQGMPDPPPVTYPTLPATAASAKEFAPKGWSLEAQSSGDLNKDGVPDLVFVMRDGDPRNILVNPGGLGAEKLDTNPRILGVAFGATAPQPYRLVLQNHTLIPRRESPTIDDYFDRTDGLAIARGAFSVKLGLFASAGGWETFSSHFTFRWQNEHVELIGFERDSTMRNSGETVLTSVNYSTGKMRIETGSIENDKKKVRAKNLPKKPLLTIERIGDGIEFQPAP
jgi:hypothetical protein